MTEDTQTSPSGDARARITGIADAIRAHVGAEIVNSYGHGVYADARKTLSL